MYYLLFLDVLFFRGSIYDYGIIILINWYFQFWDLIFRNISFYWLDLGELEFFVVGDVLL